MDKTEKSKLASSLYKWFNFYKNETFDNFGQVLNKYAKTGMTRDYLSQYFQKLTSIPINPSTLYRAWKIEKKNGRTDFVFKNSKKGLFRKKSKKLKNTKNISLQCLKCNHIIIKEYLISSLKLDLGLMFIRCPNCKKKGFHLAFFDIDQIQKYKIIINEKEEYLELINGKFIKKG